MKNNLCFLCLGIAVVAWAPVLPADVLIDENFESAPHVDGTATDDGDNDMPGWTTYEPTSAEDQQVILGASTGGSGANQNIYKYTSTIKEWTAFNRSFDPQVIADGGSMQWSFKVMFPTSVHNSGDHKESSVLAALGDDPNNGSAVRLEMRPGSGAGSGFYTVSGFGADPYNPVNLLASITPDEWYQVDIDVDFDARQWEVDINNLDDPTENASATGRGFFNEHTDPTPAVQFNKLGFSYSPGRHFDMRLDDIHLQYVPVVPEPTTLGLLALGAVLIPKLLALGAIPKRRR